ncbi:ABC transporter permease [Oleisolibacter albus]|uniref:ABC transporter permease n=1 Tax=Oleisolibacter albus TaxID=2171757 RepID=UPI000DF3FD83|nr:ABC transporter permease [Oleisolibacter albus]
MRQQFLTVFSTEFRDHGRDRRSLLAAFAYAFFGPVLVTVLLTVLAGQIKDTTPPRLAVIGAEHAPTLVSQLERRGVSIERRPAADQPVALPTLGDADAVLVIPALYAERYRRGAPAEVTLYRDELRRSSADGARTVARHLAAIGGEMAQSRLIARGVAPPLVMPIQVQEANLAGAGRGTLEIGRMLLYFFLLAPFFAGMSMAIDTTAGERERKSLQPLLAQPVDPWVLILGKWANTALFSVLGLALTVVLGLGLLRFAPLEQLGISLPLDVWTQLRVILALVPLAMAVSAVQIAVALTAKSFKEAQTYLTLLSFLPVILSFSGTLGSKDPTGPVLLAPVVGHLELLKDLVGSGTLDPGHLAGLTAGCLLLAAAALWQATRQLTGERILGG